MAGTILLEALPGTVVWGDRAATVAADIQPGMLVEPAASGEIQVHGTSEGYAQPWVAQENPQLPPNPIAGVDAVDRVYLAGQRVLYTQSPATKQWMWLINGANGNVAEGGTLSSNGDGTLRTSATNCVARAAQAVDNSGGAGPVRIEVWV